MFFNTLTPKFYVALTGTSSLISGLILIFEWWYFKRYGTSFIEQVSINHLTPMLGGTESNNSSLTNNEASSLSIPSSSTINGSNSGHNGNNNMNNCTLSNGTDSTIPVTGTNECKVWKNPCALFRGAEYQRLIQYNGKEPLTFHDMNLSAQEHQTFFTCDFDEGKPEYEMMQRAWRERTPSIRIQFARDALEKNSEFTPALILLAEEEATTIIEVERLLKQALKCAENAYRKSQQLLEQGRIQDIVHKRNTNILIYVKRRLGMCARKLGKLREATKIFRDLVKEFPMMSVFNIHENLIEVLLALQNYPDVQGVLAKYDDISLPKSATICYTAALLKARAVASTFSPDIASKRGLTAAEMSAVEAIHRAVEFNPHVPKYLLEMKSLILPPEHILKRGDSEAIAYAFFHLPHWRRVEGALNLLHCTWEGTFRMIPYPLEKGHLFHPYPTCTEVADRELLPAFHDVSVFPKKELPFFILFTAGLCSGTAMLALLTHQYPEIAAYIARLFLTWFSVPIQYLTDKIESILPSNLYQQLAKV
ncbi:unnamed protein product [Rotaria sp. Silwood2]|nr:unnamed protein product [Rotaria sp. Silwood2]CAF2729283.1 unnamed protein product [Rotaria sp. Silwood2]CAF2896812.1 unnamed protein product [Rotaria sp. Silwood2]CAF3965290.1 unnamed protein product [Rotaria sp. Silwood2]CAF4029988.1 unnamed protein product [Rotaria sp. Silwood2]